MAGQRALPGLGLVGFWDEGSNGWKPDMDENLRRLSALVQLNVASRTVPLPSSPADGAVYIVPDSAGANAKRLALRDNGAWVYLSPIKGLRATVKDEDKFYWYNGTDWVEEETGGLSAVSVVFDGNTFEADTLSFSGAGVAVTDNGDGSVSIVIGGGGGGIEEAPLDGKQYARKDGGWVEVQASGGGGGIEEAPLDGDLYGRKDGEWAKAVEEAPIDSKQYARVDGTWAEIIGGGGGSGGSFPYGGALIVPEAAQNYSAISTYDAVRFSKAVYDTDDFWSDQAPNRLTVPPGVTKVRLTAAVKVDSTDTIGSNSFVFAKNGLVNSTDGLPSTGIGGSGYNDPGGNLVSAVLDVVAGDYFELMYFANQSFDLNADRHQTFFAMEVVERTTANVGINAYVEDLIDVDYPAEPQDGDTLVWNAATEKWEPGVPVVAANVAQGVNKPFRGAMAIMAATKSLPVPIFPVPWDNTVYDTDALWSASTPGRFTIPAGVTKVRLSAAMDPDGTVLGSGNDTLAFRKNGESFPGAATNGRELGYSDAGLSIVSPVLAVEEGDFFEVHYNNSTSGNKDWSVNSYFAIEIVEATEVL